MKKKKLEITQESLGIDKLTSSKATNLTGLGLSKLSKLDKNYKTKIRSKK